MGYKRNTPAAARRHFEAAEAIVAPRSDVAGYLYGLSTEIAIKAMMIEARIPIPRTKTGPYYSHFPELATQLRDLLSGRRGGPLITLLTNPSLMRQWDITMRYSDGKKISKGLVLEWRESANQAVGLIGT